jgi:hypothetical protein
MVENLSGGTTNLLRMARSGCQSAVAFVALALGDQTFATATYPSELGKGLPTATEVEDLVRQLWLDPGLARGKALVRTLPLGGHGPGQTPSRFAVAAVPLGAGAGGQPSGILGVTDPEAKTFGVPDLELLSRIAQRLTSYVKARQAVRTQLAATTAGQGGSQPAPWWDVEPPPAPAAPAPAPAPAAPTPAPAAGSTGRESGKSQVRPPSPPPFPPPAGTMGVVPNRGPSAASSGDRAAGRPTEPKPFSEPVRAPGPAHFPEPRPSGAGMPAEAADPLGALLGGGDLVPGLLPLGALLGRAGRLLGAGTLVSGTLAVVVVAVEGAAPQSAAVVADLVRSLRTDLRFDDPLARIGSLSFVAVVPLAPGGSSPEQVEARLVDRAREAVASLPGAVVRAAHVEAPLSAGREADELLRSAVVKLRAA